MVVARAANLPAASDAEADMCSTTLELLVGFRLRSHGVVVEVPTSSQRLLAFLALNDRDIPRSYIAGILWIDASSDRAAGNLRSALWRLRLAGVHLVDAHGDCLRLTEGVQVDIRELEARARRLVDPACPSQDDDLDELPLCGELLPAWYDDWVVIERERQRQLHLHALEALCERLVAKGRLGQAVSAGLAAVNGEPLRESAHRALIKAHLAEGNPGEAIRQYRHYRALLRKELHLEPSAQLTGLMVGLGIE
jgi:DNA-binding SARP family transcriptional activator